MNVITDYKEVKPRHKTRLLWYVINATLFRWLPTGVFRRARNGLLRLFGANIHPEAIIYSSVKIFAPWNLELGRCTIGPGVNLYCKDKIIIGSDSVVSQGTTLCTASHDLSSPMMTLVTAPIHISDRVWVASEAFVGPGVTLSEGAVVGARGVVFRSVDPWTVVAGNPAVPVKKREFKS